MGGGGGGPSSIGDIRSLVERAKEALREGNAVAKRNVFLSFAFEDLDAVNLLRGQARNENSALEFNDWSVSEAIDSERATYIKQKISERIGRSSVTVVFLSDSTSKSQWVHWEIQESLRLGKRVVGVHPAGKKPKELPDAMRRNRIRSVPWADLPSTIEGLE